MINMKQVMTFLFKLVIGLLIILPIIYALSISLMNPSEFFQYPPKLIPSKLYMGNYKKMLDTIPIFKFLLNSFIVSAAITLGQIVFCTLTAYAFSFFDFKFKKVLFLLVLATTMIPGEAIIVSNFLTVAKLHLIDTYTAMILPNLVSAIGIFMMRQYLLTLPKELKEAATLDGCNSFQFLIKIVLPLAKPVIFSLGIYEFIMSWNMYMWPLLVTNSPDKRTVQIGISMLNFVDTQSYGVNLAGVLFIILPSILIFILGKKSLIEGITSGAIK